MMEIPTIHWSYNKWIATIAVAIVVCAIYIAVGPGLDYFGCYTWMVMEPERLPKVAEYPWTLNPTWIVPFMAPFVSLPGRAGYIAFMIVTLAITIYGAYLFGGKPIPILLSAHMLWILWWGQIEGWGILGLVLGWFAYRKKMWPVMFLALSVAAFKPQVGFAPVLALWWWSGRDRWKSLTALVALFAVSIWIWGPWPIWYLEGILKFVGDDHFTTWNASLGLVALPLFIPALFIPLDKEKRLIALTATAYIVSPYMPYYSTILLLFFNIPWWAYLFGLLGYFPSLIGPDLAWNTIVFLPITVLLWVYAPYVKKWLKPLRLGKANLNKEESGH